MALFKKKSKTKSIPSKVVRRKRPVFTRSTPPPKKNIIVKKQELTEKRDSFAYVYSMLWITFMGITVYIFFLSSFLRISTITVSGNSTLTTSAIQSFIQEQLNEKYIGNLSKNNYAFISESNLENELKNHFKKAKSITVTTTFPHSIHVDLEERNALIIWCSHERCWYVDEEGHAYVEADDAYADTILTIQDQSNQEIGDEAIMDKNSIATIRELQSGLKEQMRIEIQNVAQTTSRYSEELILTTKEGWVLKINHRLPLKGTLEVLRLLLAKEIVGERKEKLQYIDLRTENRAYYAIEGETVSAPETAEEGEGVTDAQTGDALNPVTTDNVEGSSDTKQADAISKKDKKKK